MKKISICLCLVMILSLVMSIGCFAANGKVTVELDGQEVMFPDAQPFINSDGRTMVPVRFVSEALGAEVTWVDELEQVIIFKDGVTIRLNIGDNIVYSDAFAHQPTIEMDTVPQIIEDRTFVPLRFVSEALNCKVDWVNETWTVLIKSTPMIMTINDWKDGEVLDIVDVEKNIIVGTKSIALEIGDVVEDKEDVLIVNKYSGLVYEQLKNDSNVEYRYVFSRDKDLNEMIKDLTDEIIFMNMGAQYPVHSILAKSWNTGIGENEVIYLNGPLYTGISIYDRGNSIVVEQAKKILN